MVNIPRQGPTAIFDLTLQLVVKKLQPGSFEGVVRIRTDDPDFPELSVPVKGEVR